MTKKKFVSILLVICMLMTLMPTFALADDDGQTPPIVDEQPLTDPTPGDPTNPQTLPAQTEKRLLSNWEQVRELTAYRAEKIKSQ